MINYLFSDQQQSYWKGGRNCYRPCFRTNTFTATQISGYFGEFRNPIEFVNLGDFNRSRLNCECIINGHCCSKRLFSQGQPVNKEFLTSLERVLLTRPLHIKHGISLYYGEKAPLEVPF